MRALFSQAMYQIVIKTRFQIDAQIVVYSKNLAIFILKIPAGILISCLTAGINLPSKVVTLQ
jgi:hypothetical protein